MSTKPTVFAEQARKAMNSQIRGLNSKTVVRTPQRLLDMAKEQSFHVFNVSWKSFLCRQGGLGDFYIPACKQGKEYSDPLTILGIVPESVAVDIGKTEERQYDGLEIVYNVLEVGGFKPDEGSEGQGLLKWGVFMAEGKLPTTQELSDARDLLRRHCEFLVSEADHYSTQAQEPGRPSNIGPDHHKALAFLGDNRDWAKRPQQMIPCPNCGDPVKPGIIRHATPNCGWIFDPERFYANQANPFDLVAAAVAEVPKRGPGRPKQSDQAAE